MANFPSILNSFTRPTTTDKLNSPSHSGLHNTVSSALGQVEAFLGVVGNSSVVGTLSYDVRSPASGGGGHVQTANKGGTGQTTYAKGDILVAQSSSVLSKLGVSANDGDVLVSSSGESAGIKWAAVTANKVQINTSSVAVAVTSIASTIFSASILGSTLGTNNAIRYKGFLPIFATGGDLTFITNYGNNVISSVVVLMGATTSIIGELSGIVVGDGNVSSQVGYMNFSGSNRVAGNVPALAIYVNSLQGSSSVNSSGDQNLNIQVKYALQNSLNSILTGPFIVEKIV